MCDLDESWACGFYSLGKDSAQSRCVGICTRPLFDYVLGQSSACSERNLDIWSAAHVALLTQMPPEMYRPYRSPSLGTHLCSSTSSSWLCHRRLPGRASMARLGGTSQLLHARLCSCTQTLPVVVTTLGGLPRTPSASSPVGGDGQQLQPGIDGRLVTRTRVVPAPRAIVLLHTRCSGTAARSRKTVQRRTA